MEAIVLLGAPGSGKGTAAARLAHGPGLRHVSTGALFREAMAGRTALGEAIRPYMDRGQLVPDELVMEMVGVLLREGSGGQRVLFDGFPRTPGQAEAFDRLLADTGSRLAHVVLLEVDPDRLVERLGARMGCEACGTIYNLLTRPPRNERTCDGCGAELSKRDDDRIATIRRRLKIYEEQTAPLIAFYDTRNMLRRVDADNTADEVAQRIRDILAGDEKTHD